MTDKILDDIDSELETLAGQLRPAAASAGAELKTAELLLTALQHRIDLHRLRLLLARQELDERKERRLAAKREE